MWKAQPVPQSEQGEFELVLGNKQLLSVFFIVVVLLAVFFFMGYVVGRNSGPAMIAGAAHTTETARATPADTGSRASAMPPATTPAPAPQTPPSETQASAPEPQAAAPATHEAPPPAPAPAPAPERAEAPAPGPQSIGEPAAGTTWLQVVATTRPDAELIGETLGKRHFHTQVAPAPNGLFRVLVGPSKNAAETSELRTRLEAAGFKNP